MLFYRILIIIIFCTIPSEAFSSIIINAHVVRNQEGEGHCLVSSGFPLPEGFVTEEIIKNGTIRIEIQGKEIPANISALRGRHHDGTIRSVLIQFEYVLGHGDILPVQVIIGDSIRSFRDPEYIRPTFEIVNNNNVVVPIDPDYICSTRITFQYLLPVGKGTKEEEKLFTLLAKDRFEFDLHGGTATYEHPRGLIALWARTGDIKYYNEALKEIFFRWAGYNFPPPDALGDNANITNSDKVSWPSQTSNIRYQTGPEWHAPRTLSYASAYLLTGYRDFWSAVAASIQGNLFKNRIIPDSQEGANFIFVQGIYDTPRYNYVKYVSLYSAMMIDATIIVPSFWPGLTADEVLLQRALNALFYHQWDIVWIPFDNWDQEFPDHGDMLIQGGVKGVILGTYFDTNAARHANENLFKQEDEPSNPPSRAWWHRPSDNAWFEFGGSSEGWVDKGQFPTSGYLQVRKSIIEGGEFTIGPVLSGINANISGMAIDDYRNGFVGTRSYGRDRTTGIPLFQTIFPANFLIDYYLNIYSDERIPSAIYELLRIVLMNIRETNKGDSRWHNRDCGPWGVVTYLQPYRMMFPISEAEMSPWVLPEYVRLIAFVIKTSGDCEINGKLLSEWYSICINTANNAPTHLNWEWKLFGQYYGMNQDAPWMMAQESLVGHGPSSIRKPTQYNAIPGDVPDIARGDNLD